MYYSKHLSKNNSSSKYHLDKTFLIEEIKNDQMNNECFDCGAPYPQYISINNGIFLCKKCIYYHYKFTDDISTLLQNNLYALRKKELKYLYYGGNRKLTEYLYFNCPKLNKYQPELLYKTEEMYYYRYKLENVVNGKISEDKLFLTQKEFYRPMSEGREKYKCKNNLKTKKYIDKNLKINTDDMSYIKNKYNYRKIPANNKKHAFDNNFNYNNNQKAYRTEANRKEYKKRYIPSYNSNSYKASSDSYKDQNSRTYRQNRFYIDTYFSNDSYLSKKKTFEQNNDIYSNKFEFDNTGSNSWLKASSNNDEKIMNSSYQGQNINYKNYINNTININSPNNNNFYYNFKTDNNIISKSPDIKNLNNNFRYFSNNKSSKYQSFYKNLSIQIPSKIILIDGQTSRSFALSSSRVYSKPKLPRCKINKGKKLKNSENVGNYYLTLQNDKNKEQIKNKILLNSLSQKKIPKLSKDIIISLKNNVRKNKPTNPKRYAEVIFNINSMNTFEKIMDNNINQNEIIKENENNELKEYVEEHPIKIVSENLIDVKIEGDSNEITYDDKNKERNNDNNKGEINKINNLKDKNQQQNNPIVVKRKDSDSNFNNNETKKELEADKKKKKR